MTALITLTLIIVCVGLLFAWLRPRRKPKIYLMSEDDKALWDHDRKKDEDKVLAMRHTRECDRRRYEGITWPAMLWEHRARQIMQHVITRRVA